MSARFFEVSAQFFELSARFFEFSARFFEVSARFFELSARFSLFKLFLIVPYFKTYSTVHEQYRYVLGILFGFLTIELYSKRFGFHTVRTIQ